METVEGGGLVLILLKSFGSLQSLIARIRSILCTVTIFRQDVQDGPFANQLTEVAYLVHSLQSLARLLVAHG